MDYFDLKFKEKRNTEDLFSDCFGRACKSLNIGLNEGYRSYKEDKENSMRFEDDTIIYIVKLCSSFTRPDIQKRFKDYLLQNKIDLFNKLDTRDKRLKYIIYKTNADFLLLSFVVFSDENLHYQRSIEMGKYFYRSASAYKQEIGFGDRDGLAGVLMKLAINFEKYADILSFIKRNNLSSYKLFTDDESSGLIDKFLDAHETWRTTGKGEEELEDLKIRINDKYPGYITKIFSKI